MTLALNELTDQISQKNPLLSGIDGIEKDWNSLKDSLDTVSEMVTQLESNDLQPFQNAKTNEDWREIFLPLKPIIKEFLKDKDLSKMGVQLGRLSNGKGVWICKDHLSNYNELLEPRYQPEQGMIPRMILSPSAEKSPAYENNYQTRGSVMKSPPISPADRELAGATVIRQESIKSQPPMYTQQAIPNRVQEEQEPVIVYDRSVSKNGKEEHVVVEVEYAKKRTSSWCVDNRRKLFIGIILTLLLIIGAVLAVIFSKPSASTSSSKTNTTSTDSASNSGSNSGAKCTDSCSNGLKCCAVTNYYVTTMAGSKSAGANNGRGATASFYEPSGIAIDSFGKIFIADSKNCLIRVIAPDGTVATLAGLTTNSASPICSFTDGKGTATFNDPQGISVDSVGTVYVADTLNDKIRKITSSGDVSTLTGMTSGYSDSTLATSQFSAPNAVAFQSAAKIWVADSGNSKIRIISQSSVTTFNPNPPNPNPIVSPKGIAIDSSASIIYIANSAAHSIGKIDPSGEYSTIAGSSSGTADGQGTFASFNQPVGIAVDPQGNLFVADSGNHLIRKIDTQSAQVTTIAGTGIPGSADGSSTNASFFLPTGIAIGQDNVLYVTDRKNHMIRKLYPPGSSVCLQTCPT